MKVGIVAIGRNEGERLRRCLASAKLDMVPVVYVDSGSTDGSPEFARSSGAEVIDLDMSVPFTAARGRNVGFDRLVAIYPNIEFVQFVDGDCEIVSGWLDRAIKELESRPTVGVVCGRRRERHPEASIYNRLCDIEWNTPVGEIRSCGGDSMVRVSAFRAIGGFDASVAAGEEPEMCKRMRAAGWRILRIDADMTLHDAAITKFRQWWRRQYRGGYGSMDLYRRWGFAEDRHYVHVIRSARIWTIGWVIVSVLAIILGFVFSGGAGAVTGATVTLGLLAVQAARVGLKAHSSSVNFRTALLHGFLTVVSKWPQFLAQLAYSRDNRRARPVRLIEYK